MEYIMFLFVYIVDTFDAASESGGSVYSEKRWRLVCFARL